MWRSSCILLLIIFLKGQCVEQYCELDNAGHCSERDESFKYTKDSNEKYEKYIAAIQKAESSYVECNATGCECFKNIIVRDLKPFKKNGLSKELIDMARTRGTFYQIIGGELYREKDCMFPSRCAGIEHFLLKIVSNLTDMDFVVNTRDYPQSSQHFGRPLPVFSFSKHGHFGKEDLLYPCILVVLGVGINIASY